MSRIGLKPIEIPAGVDVKVDGTTVTVKGPKGELTRNVHPNMAVAVEGNEVIVKRPNDEKANKSLHGLTRTLIHNMVLGVTEGLQEESGSQRCWLQSTGTEQQAHNEPWLFSPGDHGRTGRHYH